VLSLLLVLTLFTLLAWLLVSARPPGAEAASADGPCVGDTGVTVVVDATKAGGGISVRCALGPQASGWDALQNSGHAITSVPQYPGTAVCTVDGRPSAGYPTCWETNFWSYHHAPNTRAGAAWTFSGVGAATYKPAPGSVEGWKYTSTANRSDAPGAGPVFAAPPTTGTTPPAPPPPPASGGGAPPAAAPRGAAPQSNTSPGSGSGAPTGPAAPSDSSTNATTTLPPAAGAPETTDSAPGPTAGATTAPSTGAGAEDGDDGASDSREIAAEPARDTTDSGGGFPFATVIGAVLIVALATGAGFVARQRRTSTSDGS
jgi:hypothetical protein